MDSDKDKSIEELKKLYNSPDRRHASGAWFDEKAGKWREYRPTKGVMPPWKPYDYKRRRKRLTLRERKFLAVLSITGNMREAYRASYKVKKNRNKKLESIFISSRANLVLKRIREKDPELVRAITFEDISPDFVRKGLLDLYSRAKEKGNMHIEKGVLELMGKTQALFTDKQIVQEKVGEVVDDIYQETDEDIPKEVDKRLSRADVDKKIFNA